MELTKLKLTGITIDPFVNFIIKQIEFDYEKHSLQMSVLIKEEISSWHQYYQVNILTINQQEDGLYLEINSNGIEGRIIDHFVDSKTHFARDFVRILLNHCENLNFRMEKI